MGREIIVASAREIKGEKILPLGPLPSKYIRAKVNECLLAGGGFLKRAFGADALKCLDHCCAELCELSCTR